MAWILPVLAIGSSLLNGYMASKQAGAANKRSNQIYNTAMPYTQMGPTGAENILNQLLTGGNNPLGSDSIMQALRADPAWSSMEAMVSGGGQPFDQSKLWAAYLPVRERNLQASISGMRAGATGLGQRFGQSMLTGEKNLRLQAAQDWNAADTTMAANAYEAAKGRQMGAANTLLQNILQATQSGQANQLGMLQLLGNLQNATRGQNLQALGIAAGVPTPQFPQYGGYGMDIVQFLMMQHLFNQLGNKGKTPSSLGGAGAAAMPYMMGSVPW